jgi:hypothetical protein
VTIRRFFQKKENGQIFFETELVVNGHSKDVLMNSVGTVVEVEERIPTESLSPTERDGLQAKAGNGSDGKPLDHEEWREPRLQPPILLRMEQARKPTNSRIGLHNGNTNERLLRHSAVDERRLCRRPRYDN